ncbi:alpha/beta fold hydrolase [Streptomyces sp. NPDC048603]|uniref:alpha/beta fold hydrolase n=1 Tax=Streptomyces sp. NPDC048603 TaxID=3365577 RepID=UPI0037110140
MGLVEVVVPGMGLVDRLEALQPSGVRRVSGDERAGVYRTAGVREHGPGVVREVYDWARLTIGGATRALWLFLLPFLLVNQVAWMQPFRLDRRPASALYRWITQMLGLSLTVLAVAAFAQGAMDQLVWQCGTGGPAGGVCKESNPLVHFVRQHGTGTAMLLAALVPVVGLAAMSFSARDGRQEYRSVARTAPLAGDPWKAVRRAETPARPLATPLFWEYNWRARGLAARHMCAGVLTLALLLTVPAYASGAGDTAGRLLFAAVAAGAVLVSAGSLWWPGRLGERAVGAGCLLTLAGSAAYYDSSGGERTSQAMLPGIGTLTALLLLGQALLLLALGALCLWTPRHPDDRVALRGLAGVAVGVLACFSAWLCSTAVLLWTQDWLTAEPERQRVELPAAVRANAAALPTITVVAAGLTGLGLALLALRRWWAARPWPRTEAEKEAYEERRHALALAAARASAAGTPARMLVRAEQGLAAAAGLVTVTVGGFGAVAVHDPGYLNERYQELMADIMRLLTSLGSFMLVALILAVLLVARTIVLRADSRRYTGMIWAFGAFWPRSGHPFTPATWTGRSIPEFTHRLTALLEGRPETRVLLNCHSMGSMIAVLALWQARPEYRPRIALLTTGCPLTNVFRRLFPAYVTREAVDDLAAGAGGPDRPAAWANVRRDTDVLAGSVGHGLDLPPWPDGVAPEAADGTEAAAPGPREAAQPVFVPLHRHDFYRVDPRIEPVRAELFDVLRQV